MSDSACKWEPSLQGCACSRLAVTTQSLSSVLYQGTVDTNCRRCTSCCRAAFLRMPNQELLAPNTAGVSRPSTQHALLQPSLLTSACVLLAGSNALPSTPPARLTSREHQMTWQAQCQSTLQQQSRTSSTPTPAPGQAAGHKTSA